MKTFASQIYAAVHTGRLTQPFNAAMVRKACPGWAERTYIRVSSESGSVFDTECQGGKMERHDTGPYRVVPSP
jgi:hypothetical protein